MDIIAKHCRNRARLTQDFVEDVMREHHTAMRAFDVERIVSECLGLSDFLQRTWEMALDYLFSNRPGNIDDLYPIFERAVQDSIGTLKTGKRLAQRCAVEGYPIRGADGLANSIPALEQLLADVRSKWPVHDSQMADEALAAFKRGESRLAEELLLESQGHNPQPH